MTKKTIDPNNHAELIASVIAQTNTIERVLNNVIAKHLGADTADKLAQFLELTNHDDKTILATKFRVAATIEKETLGSKTLGKKGKIDTYLKIRNDFAHNTITNNTGYILEINGKDTKDFFKHYVDFFAVQAEILKVLLEVDKKLDGKV